ncbi:HK97-gp10 family putative phage morphogenesis protein [Janibacter melonis]|uniref:HK97-gp10 family putative phage morphogenesis protein n=1 Tax=Janibacter melonis TaxID=262209 RepID=UPI00174E42DE|nr:HK97-gp10 family putative phage morphogenesis protein [Janibacter melonis]
MRIVGDVELIDALDNAQQRVGGRAAGVLRATGAQIVRSAKINAPVDTGNLRATIGSTTTGDGRNGTMRIEIGPTASYGVYVETGTSRMAGKPYLYPAVDQHAPGYYAALERIAGDL